MMIVSQHYIILNIFKNISLCITVTVQYENIVVRGDESAGTLTFALVTSRPADVSFTVQVCTRELNNTGFGLGVGYNSNGFATG